MLGYVILFSLFLLPETDSNFIYYKSIRQRLQLEKGQQTNLVSISSGNTENWGESNMADASPRTDISTDADTDERNQMVCFISHLLFISHCCNLIIFWDFFRHCFYHLNFLGPLL